MITAVVICLVLFLSLYRINMADNSAKIAGEIMTSILEGVIFRNDYLRSNMARAKEQWFAKHEQINILLKSALQYFPDAEDKKSILEMIGDNESEGRVFSTIVANREKKGLNFKSDDLSPEVEGRLLNQLNMRIYEVVLHGRTLLDSSRKARVSAFRLAGGSIIAMLTILILAAIVMSWSMSRAVADRVRRLGEGAAVIGGGNLDYRIDVKGDDEFAELSDAFNVMASRLRSSYHDLENEIIERKHVEEALRRSEEHFRALAEALPQIVWTADAKGGIEWFNRRWYEYTGQQQGVGEGWSWDMVAHPDDMAHTLKNWAEAQRISSLFQNEIRLCSHDGEYRWFMVRAWPLRDADGNVVRWFGTNTDIHDMKVAEAALRQSREDLQRLARQRQLALDASRMGWWHYDPVTRIASWDERYKEIFAVKDYQRPNDEILTRLHPEDLPGVWAKVESALDPVNPTIYEAEYRINLPDGSVRWIEAHGIASFEGAGEKRRAVSFVGTVADITNRKQAEGEIERHTKELLSINEELERFNRAAVGRELRMIDLKKEINALCTQLGQPPRYPSQAEEEQG